jgi:hypothetical protein
MKWKGCGRQGMWSDLHIILGIGKYIAGHECYIYFLLSVRLHSLVNLSLLDLSLACFDFTRIPVIALNPGPCIYNLSMSIWMPRTLCTLRCYSRVQALSVTCRYDLVVLETSGAMSREKRGEEPGHGSTCATRRHCCRLPCQDDISRIQRRTEL